MRPRHKRQGYFVQAVQAVRLQTGARREAAIQAVLQVRLPMGRLTWPVIVYLAVWHIRRGA